MARRVWMERRRKGVRPRPLADLSHGATVGPPRAMGTIARVAMGIRSVVGVSGVRRRYVIWESRPWWWWGRNREAFHWLRNEPQYESIIGT